MIFTCRQWTKEKEGCIAENAAGGIWGARGIFETSKSGVGGGIRIGITRFKRGCKMGTCVHYEKDKAQLLDKRILRRVL